MAVAEPTPEPTVALEEPAPDGPVEEILAAAVQAFFDAREAANEGPQPDPADPSLAKVATGTALDSVFEETSRRLAEGRAIRPGEQNLAGLRVGFVDAEGVAASLSACSIDDGVIYDVATNEIVNDDVVTHNYLVGLELADGTWKVAEITRVQQWEGVAGCALAPGDYPY